MEITKREIAFEGKHLRLMKKYSVTKEGQEHIWETVERTDTYNRGAVVIVPVTKNGELILERNWRAPIESFVIQFPAGLTDIQGESEEETAKRELLEETGYVAGELIPIILAPLSPALTPTEANHYFAPDAEFVGKENKEATEEIEVITVPIKEARKFLLNLPDDTKLDLRVPGILWVLEAKGII